MTHFKITGTAYYFTARRYASAVYVVVVCPFVRLFITLTRRYRTKMAKRITQTTPYDIHVLWFFDAKDLGEIPTVSPPTGRQMEVE